MKRKIDQILEDWASEGPGHPLLVRGARRVGKTYAVKRLGIERFGSENFAYCDFQTDLRNLTQIFEESRTIDEVVSALSLFLHIDIRPHETLLAFDEIQLCEKALNFLRFFDEGDYYVIATGSQLGLTLRDRELPFPSNINHYYLRPLDFEEFLWAMGEERMVNAIREAMNKQSKLIVHDQALELYRRYGVVGGMPRVVRTYLETNKFQDVRTVQAEIAETYAADIALYAPANESVRVRQIWNSIPAQIARESSGKFKYSDVVSGGRHQQFRTPLAWLEAAELVLLNEQTNEVSAPLVPRDDGSFFKVYLLDTGLLFYRMNLDAELFLHSERRKIINPRFRGALAENYIKQSLVANNITSYYWVGANGAASEVEFVIQDRAGRVIPIEVKSGSNVTSASLRNYGKKCSAPVCIRISEKNIGLEEGLFSVPLYAAFCLDEEFLLSL